MFIRRERDTQRAKVYKAEREVKDFLSSEKMSLDEIRSFVKGFMSTAWWRENFPRKTIFTLKDGRGCRSAYGGGWGKEFHISMPVWSRSKIIVLHEIAHGLQPDTSAGHGAEFCQIYLSLVYRYLGSKVGNELRASFTRNNVSYRSLRFNIPWASFEVSP